MKPDQNQPATTKAKGRLIDFGPSKHVQGSKPPKLAVEPEPDNIKPEQQPVTTVSETNENRPTPVTSAQAAINARYAHQPRPVPTPLVSSAREAVNASAAQQGTSSSSMTAANLHHGKIQRNMESTRTSASALIKRAEDSRKSVTPTSASVSGDPLSHFGQPAPARSVRQETGVPVVRTSLKLGASARPKQPPMVFPANAKIAQAARPVGKNPAMMTRKTAPRMTPREAIDAQVIQPDVLAAPRPVRNQLQSGKTPNQDVAVNVHPNGTGASTGPQRPTRRPAASRTAATNSQRFRTKPKDFSANQPTAMPVDSGYVMTEPPKIRAQRHENPAPKPETELGVVENYRAQSQPKPQPEFTIKSENTSNYSFSQPKDSPDNNRYALGGQSPFIKTVNVEKRPLSDNVAPGAPVRPASYSRAELVQADALMPGSANARLSKKDRKAAAKAEKSARKNKKQTSASTPVQPARREAAKTEPRASRKNRYDKKTAKQSRINPRPDLPPKPTVIVPSSRRSKAPLFFLIVLTMLLGAAVGGAVYLCFFQ